MSMNKTRNGKATDIGERVLRHHEEMGFTLEKISETQCRMLYGKKTVISCVAVSRLYSAKMLCGFLKGIGFLPEDFELSRSEPIKVSERIERAREDAMLTTLKATAEKLKATGIPQDTAVQIIGSDYSDMITAVYATNTATDAATEEDGE